MKPTLFILAKAPRIGTAKSRLARDIGLVPAWRINRTLNKHTLHTAPNACWNTVLAVAAPRDLAVSLPTIWPRALKRIVQPRGDLGARLRQIFQSAPRGPVLVIGTDCPALQTRDIADAIAALKRADAVFGPASDGGFWLMGLSAALAKRVRFANVRWSTSQTLADTLTSVNSRKTIYIRMLTDIDDSASLRAAYCERRRLGPVASAMRGLSMAR